MSTPERSGQSVRQSPYEEALAMMSKEIYADTKDVRNALINRGGDVVSGNFDPMRDPAYSKLYAGSRQGLEDQFNVAKESVMSQTPAGGQLNGALNELEMERAKGVGSMSNQIAQQVLADELNKAYGFSFAAPGQAMQGMGMAAGPYSSRVSTDMMTRSQERIAKMGQLNNAIVPNCCFIFVAGHGYLHPVVRRFRDEHMTERNRRGYYRMADWLVPKMRKSSAIKWAVRMLMVDPMTSHGKWYYGHNRVGILFRPLSLAWLKAFDWLGGNGPYVRSNGDII